MKRQTLQQHFQDKEKQWKKTCTQRALEKVKKFIEVDNSEGIPERMKRNIKPIQGQEELITGNIHQRDKIKKIQH